MTVFAGNRVLMLLENNPYPQDGRVRREAAALVTAGYEVSVVCPANSGQKRHEIIRRVKVFRYPAPREANGFLGYLWEYGYSMVATFVISVVVFLRHGFDVIHAHNPPDTFLFVAVFYKLFGKKFVFDHHDLAPEMYYARFGGNGSRLVYRTLVWLEKLSCRLADHVIATNESYKSVEMERDRLPKEQITIVRNGPDLDRLRRVEPDPSLRRRAKTIIGYVGVMGFQDGVDYLVRSLRHLVDDVGRTDFFCVIIGKGDAWASLKVLATELDLDDYVWFTGRVSDADLLRYLSTADICVDPDPSNPFNDRSTMIKMTEYMALGKPIVAFDLPEHRYTARDAALYVSPNDELEFARALAQLMDNPERRQAMGASGRQRVENELAWDHSIPRLLKAYRTVLGESSGEGLPSVGATADS
jgi:glycosyltransferase involved in cell wall biosynthesis